MVECPCKPSGCTHTCQRQHLASHLKSDCLFVQVSCCEDNCEQFLLKKDIRKHSDGCVHRTVTCEACDGSVKFIDLEVSRLLHFSVGNTTSVLTYLPSLIKENVLQRRLPVSIAAPPFHALRSSLTTPHALSCQSLALTRRSAALGSVREELLQKRISRLACMNRLRGSSLTIQPKLMHWSPKTSRCDTGWRSWRRLRGP